VVSYTVQRHLFGVVPKYLNSATFSKDSIAVFILQFCPADLSQEMNIQLAFSASMSRSTSLLETDKTGVGKKLAGTRADNQWQSQTHELKRWECQYHYFLRAPNDVQ